MLLLFLVLCVVIGVGNGFDFVDVVPRVNDVSSYFKPSIVCDDDRACLVVFEVNDPANGVNRRIAARKSLDGGVTWGDQVFVSTEGFQEPSVSCSSKFCSIVFKSLDNLQIVGAISLNFGDTFSDQILIFQDASGLQAPKVSCLLENVIPTCVLGFRSNTAGGFRFFKTKQNQLAQYTDLGTVSTSGNRVGLSCLDEEFCMASFGTNAQQVSLVKIDSGNGNQISSTVTISQSDALALVSGTPEARQPFVQVVDAQEIFVVSANKKGSVPFAIEVSRSTDGGVTFEKFQQLFANPDFNVDEGVVSCSGKNCALVWEVDGVPAVPLFVTTQDGFATISQPASFANLDIKENAPVDMYEDLSIACFDETSCVAVCEGENFLDNIAADIESIVVTALVIDNSIDDDGADADDALLTGTLVALGVIAGLGLFAALYVYNKEKDGSSSDGNKSTRSIKPQQPPKPDLTFYPPMNGPINDQMPATPAPFFKFKPLSMARMSFKPFRNVGSINPFKSKSNQNAAFPAGAGGNNNNFGGVPNNNNNFGNAPNNNNFGGVPNNNNFGGAPNNNNFGPNNNNFGGAPNNNNFGGAPNNNNFGGPPNNNNNFGGPSQSRNNNFIGAPNNNNFGGPPNGAMPLGVNPPPPPQGRFSFNPFRNFRQTMGFGNNRNNGGFGAQPFSSPMQPQQQQPNMNFYNNYV